MEPAVYASYLQMIDASGNLEYPVDGMSLDVDASHSLYMSSVGSSILIGWVESEYGQQFLLKGQKIVNGQLQWGPEGKTILISPSDAYVFLKGMAGSYFMWEVHPPNSDYNYCKALLVDANGDPAPGWNPEGINLITGHGYLSEVLGRNGLMGDDLVAFIHLYSSVSYGTRVQRLSSSGERLWSDGGTIVGATDAWMNIGSAIFEDGITFLTSNYDDGIKLRRIDTQGLETTPAEGIVVVPATSNCYDATLVKFANGSMLCAYSDYDGALIQNRDVFIRHISPDGVAAGDGPIPLCSARYQQENVRMAVIGNRALVTWNDARAGIIDSEELWQGIWGNLVTSAFTASEDPQLSPVTRPVIVGNWPNPFNPSTTISFSLPSSGPASLAIYNLKGQLVKELLSSAPMESGSHSIIWNGLDDSGRAVSSGIYFCRLVADGHTALRKMLLAK